MKYGFLDESGDVDFTAAATVNFVVVIVVVGRLRPLQIAVKKLRRDFGRHLKTVSELKASQNDPRITRRLLTRAVEAGFEALAVVVDKRKLVLPADPEDLYRDACARAVREALERFGSLTLTLDRRYRTFRLQSRLDEVLSACLMGLSGKTLAIHHENSEKERALQVADAVAWALFQKYERGDETLWQVIQGRVIEVGP